MTIKFKITLTNWGPYRKELENHFEELEDADYIFLNATPGGGKHAQKRINLFALWRG